MAIPKFNIPNLCGASPELNNALSKIADLKDSINVNINQQRLSAKTTSMKARLPVKEMNALYDIYSRCGGKYWKYNAGTDVVSDPVGKKIPRIFSSDVCVFR